MAEERKRVERKVPPKILPKKRVVPVEPIKEEVKKEVKTKPKAEKKLPPKPEPVKEAKKTSPKKEQVKVEANKPEPKAKAKKVIIPEPVKVEPIEEEVPEAKKVRPKSLDKYIRFTFKDLSDSNTIQTINRRVIAGEIKFAYYATDNDIGYHYYIVIKK
jgi:hypothetical protein